MCLTILCLNSYVYGEQNDGGVNIVCAATMRSFMRSDMYQVLDKDYQKASEVVRNFYIAKISGDDDLKKVAYYSKALDQADPKKLSEYVQDCIDKYSE